MEPAVRSLDDVARTRVASAAARGGGRRQHEDDVRVAVEPVPELVRAARRRRRARPGAGGRLPRRADRDPEEAVDGADLGGGESRPPRARPPGRPDPTKTPLVSRHAAQHRMVARYVAVEDGAVAKL